MAEKLQKRRLELRGMSGFSMARWWRSYRWQLNQLESGSTESTKQSRPLDFSGKAKAATLLLQFIVIYVYSLLYTPLWSDVYNVMTIRGWARPDAMDMLDFGLNMTADTLDFYINHTNVDFPLPKIDVVAVPDFEASAMENWGLITYRETALLNKAGKTSESAAGGQAFTIAHEMGHQYFGNLVTHDWWEYMLLKEGGATYMAYTSLPVIKPTWGYDDMVVLDEMTTAMSADALPNPRPVQMNVATPSEIAAGFDRAIAYSKGPVILRMCENIIGKPAFKKGLQTYMKRYAFGTATNDDFWECMQEAVDAEGALNVNVADVMHTWVLQPGFPIVNITRKYEGSGEISFKAEQARFLIGGNEATKRDDLLWFIPVWFRTNTTATNTEPVWMEKQPAINHGFPGSDADWLLVNPDKFGYYRVNYDTKNWQLLIDQLLSNHKAFSISSRATLVDDSFTLAGAGLLGYSVALGITRYLENERDYVPWAMTTSAMSYLDKILVTSGAYGSFIKYMVKQITPLYDVLGWKDEGTHLEFLLRGLSLRTACKYGLPDCQDQALNLFHQWMANETNNPIPINYKSTVYCTAISAGSTEEFDFALRRYKESPDASERSVLLWSLSCSRQSWALNSLLHYTLDSAETIKAQDVPSTLSSVASNPLGTSLAWDFFRENYDIFRERFGDSLFHFSNIVLGVTQPFTSEFHLKELEKFMAEHPDQGTGASAFERAVEKIKINIEWLKTHYGEVKDWLDHAVAAA